MARARPSPGLGLRLALLCACSALASCEQSPDVVANLSALRDGGPVAGSGAEAPQPRCETSQLYVLFSSIVRNGCRVQLSVGTITALGAFFLQNPPPPAPGETRAPSSCDLADPRFFWSYPIGEERFLCPNHCAAADAYVAAEDQRVLECQGFGG